MPVVKRYPNRKLYDTQAKRYVTLDGIAELIRQGEDVQVIDYTTGEDITALTLTQIIFEQEKRKSGLLPLSTLTGLIRVSGDRLTTLQKTIFSATFWQQIDEDIRARIKKLVKLGEISAEEGERLLDKLLHPEVREHESSPRMNGITTMTNQELEDYLHERQIPTQDDLGQLYSQLETLAKKLEGLSEPETGPGQNKDN